MNYSRKNIEFLAEVNSKLTLKKMKKETLAKAMGVSKSSLYEKLNHPEKFSILELRILCDVLKIPAANRGMLV